MKEIKELLNITQNLKAKYGRSFTLDGRLVGDIGEVLAAEKYGLELYSENTPLHDGKEKTTGREVQIKSSFKGNSYFPCGEVPAYFLSLNINESGELEELYNGPGQYVVDHYIIKNRLKPYKNHYYTLAKGVLKRLNEEVPKDMKIKEALNLST